MEYSDFYRPQVWSVGDCANYIGVSNNRFNALVDYYSIPYQATAAGKIFFKIDVVDFQEMRKAKGVLRPKKK